MSWVMEGANMGYADLSDGSRVMGRGGKDLGGTGRMEQEPSFLPFSLAGELSGAFPPGNIYGAGSPTGNVYIEDSTLGLAGTYLVACSEKEVMACLPQWKDGYIEMGEQAISSVKRRS